MQKNPSDRAFKIRGFGEDQEKTMSLIRLCPHRQPIPMMFNSKLKKISASWKNESAVASNQWSIVIFCCNCQILNYLNLLFSAWSGKYWSFGKNVFYQAVQCYPAIVQEITAIITSPSSTLSGSFPLSSKVRLASVAFCTFYFTISRFLRTEIKFWLI